MPAWATRGHERALAAVARAVRAGQPAHAWLFVGPAGVGKSTLAWDLAAGLLCQAADAAERPCGSCQGCRKVAHGNHPDVHRLAPDGAGRQVRIGRPDASEPGTVRHLVRELSLAPLEGAYRVAIVEDADRMNEDAQNALLKTLEEPGPDTCVVLCARQDETLLPTLRSRCRRLRLGAVSLDAIERMLVDRGLADAPRASALARLSWGRPGRAVALSRDPDAIVAHERLVRELLDLAGAGRADRLAAAPGLLAAAAAIESVLTGSGEGDGAAANAGDAAGTADDQAAAAVGQRRAPAARRGALLALGMVWEALARDLSLASRGGRASLRFPQVLEDVVALAARLEPGAADAFLGRIDALLAAVEESANPELVLDVLLLEWPRAA